MPCSTSVCNWLLNQCRDVSPRWATHTRHIKVFCFWYTPSGLWMKSVPAASLGCHVLDWCFSLCGLGLTHCVLLITYSLLISCVHIKVFILGMCPVVLFNQTNWPGFMYSTCCVILLPASLSAWEKKKNMVDTLVLLITRKHFKLQTTGTTLMR